MHKIIAVIQARMSSERLPGKILMDLNGIPTLKRIHDRVKSAMSIDEVVIATSVNPKDDVIENFCRDSGMAFVRGPEDDVCERFCMALEKFPAENVARFCADSPFQDPAIIDQIADVHLKGNFDYTTNGWNLTRTYPLGVDVRLGKSSVLIEGRVKRSDALKKMENPFAYLHEHLDQYRTIVVEASPDLKRPELRFILDYPLDREIIVRTLKLLPHQENFTTADLIDAASKDPEILKMMNEVKFELSQRKSTTSKDLNYLV